MTYATAVPQGVNRATALTANERATKLAAALRSIANFADVCAHTEIDLRIETLRAAFEDVALMAGRAADDGEGA